MSRKPKPVQDDLGLTTRDLGSTRFINRDGTFNVVRYGLPWWRSMGVYDRLITMGWMQFYLLILTFFTLINIGFGSIYFLLSPTDLMGVIQKSELQRFTEDIFFSAQTLTTVGYGRISPLGFWPSAIASFESLLGLLIFALFTGLLFARFSRPKASIIYSEHALIAPYRGITGFMFRIANARNNQLIEVDVQITVSLLKQPSNSSNQGAITTDNKNKIPNTIEREFHNLDLERKRIDFFPLSWTIVHPIDESSPLFGMDAERLVAYDPEFFILIKAFDDVFSQTVHSRFSYKVSEVVWGGKFKVIFGVENGSMAINLSRLSEFEPVPLSSSIEERLKQVMEVKVQEEIKS